MDKRKRKFRFLLLNCLSVETISNNVYLEFWKSSNIGRQQMIWTTLSESAKLYFSETKEWYIHRW